MRGTSICYTVASFLAWMKSASWKARILSRMALQPIARQVNDLLHRSFGNVRGLSHHFRYAWPPITPDLNQWDYCSWGYLKSEIFRDRPTYIGMLKENIRYQFSLYLQVCCTILFTTLPLNNSYCWRMKVDRKNICSEEHHLVLFRYTALNLAK